MSEEVSTLDLRALDLAPGAAARLRVRPPAVDLVIGGQDFVTEPARPELDLEVSRSLSGLHLHLRGELALVGPCFRCLEPAHIGISLDTSEFVAEGRPDDAPFDEDFDSIYVENHVLDLGAWTRDAVAEAMPATVLCRDDCAGLCPVCGADRNTVSCDCAVEVVDSRWDALKELAERLGDDPKSG